MPKVLLLLVLTLLACPAAAREGGREIKVGEKLTIRSSILHEDRPFWIYLPESYNDKGKSLKAYPVLYLLDGDTHFQSAGGVVQFMSANSTQIPELIIVAVLNTDRTRDFTPTHAPKNAESKADVSFPTSGGAGAFLKFLRAELIPHIEANYRTLPYRILVGHSMGGVLAVHTLLSAPTTFQGIIAIDPSLWWDKQILVKRGRVFLPAAKALRNNVFISMANHPHVFDDPKPWDDAIRAFAQSLADAPSPKLRSKFQYFEKEDHGSVPLMSLYQGLLFIFEGYKPPWSLLLRQPSDVTAHFKNVSERLGVELLPPEQFVDTMGHVLMGQMREVDKAIEVFKLNVANYPKSYGVYDSLAEAYEVKGDKASAASNYGRSLELNPENQNAKDRLKKLREQ